MLYYDIISCRAITSQTGQIRNIHFFVTVTGLQITMKNVKVKKNVRM